jgi:hypothetical protein
MTDRKIPPGAPSAFVALVALAVVALLVVVSLAPVLAAEWSR